MLRSVEIARDRQLQKTSLITQGRPMTEGTMVDMLWPGSAAAGTAEGMWGRNDGLGYQKNDPGREGNCGGSSSISEQWAFL